MPSVPYGGPKLPRSLLDQIDGNSASTRNAYGHDRLKNRKTQRKLEREKAKLRSYRTKSDVTPLQLNTTTKGQNDDAAVVARRKERKAGKRSAKLSSPTLKYASPPAGGEHGQAKRINSSPLLPIEHPPTRVTKLAAKDDAEIAALEKKLGIKHGTKKLPKSFEDDGLDTLIGSVDEAEESDGGHGGKGKRKIDEEGKQWLESKRRKLHRAQPDGRKLSYPDVEDETSQPCGSIEPGQSRDTSDDTSQDGASLDSAGQKLIDELHSSSETGADEVEDLDNPNTEVGLCHDRPRRRENPYIAPGADSSVEIQLPPLNDPTSSDAEAIARLRRQLQGLLNRLSEANLVSIVSAVENLYRGHPRQHVTSSLIELLLASVCDRTALSDTFIILHAGFIAAMYKTLGLDFGARLVEQCVEVFDRHYCGDRAKEESAKETTNLVSLLSQLYNLQVVGCDIIFDYIRSFLRELNELHTELLLRIIRSSGPLLRQDDPSSLKDIVIILQKTVAMLEEGSLSVRTRFMIEAIDNLKNNKMKTGITASALASEHLTRMKKLLGALPVRSMKASEPMRVTLTDIRNSEARGRWWLVGSSWKGGSNVTAESKTTANTNATGLHNDQEDDMTEPASDLLQLAKEQRMNTDIRRAIFITIMSASDYKDAHVQLKKLNLTRTQELEIPRVLLHCAGIEKTYNPYYTLISKKLCGDHKLKKAFEFALWDVFKKMGLSGAEALENQDEDANISTPMIVNLAKLYGNLIASGSLRMNILKNLDLLYLPTRTKTFVEVMLVTTIVLCNDRKRHSTSSLASIFNGANGNQQLVAGLQYFLGGVVAKTDLAKNKTEKAVVKEACRVIRDHLAAVATAP